MRETHAYQPPSHLGPVRRRRRLADPAAPRHGAGAAPFHHRRGAEDHQQQHAGHLERAVERGRAGVLPQPLGRADPARLDGQPGPGSRPGDRMEAPGRQDHRAEVAPRRPLPQRRRADRRGRGLLLLGRAPVRGHRACRRQDAVCRELQAAERQGAAGRHSRHRPPPVARAARGRGGGQVYRSLPQRDAGRDAGRAPLRLRVADRQQARVGRGRELRGMGQQARHHRPLQGRGVPPRRLADAGGLRRLLVAARRWNASALSRSPRSPAA